MSKTLIFVAATNAKGRRFRCGTGFTADGTLIDPSKWDEEKLIALRDDPCLTVRPATEEEIERLGGAVSVQRGAAVDLDLQVALVEVISGLPAEGFTDKGKPKIDAVRELSDLDAKSITKAAVDAAFKQLVDGGFTAPTAA